jgi:hypothetical protein
VEKIIHLEGRIIIQATEIIARVMVRINRGIIIEITTIIQILVKAMGIKREMEGIIDINQIQI